MTTFQTDLLRRVASHGLASLGLHYVARPDGSFFFPGKRPGPGWHRHGVLRVQPHDMISGRLVKRTVLKQRWRLRGTNRTQHSRPPDDIGRRYSALVIAICVFVWLDAALGLHRHPALFPDLDDKPSRRTIQRWYAAALPVGLPLQHHLRGVLLELPEPRPAEDLFPGGLPPPPSSPRQRWRAPEPQGQLFQALAMLFGTSMALDQPSSSLLAEARRRAEAEHRRSE